VAAVRIAGPLDAPPDARIIAVGGSTLGGSGKTPLCVACARLLAGEGLRVGLVGHGYGARPGVGRRVAPDDCVAEVGDEALMAARQLAPTGAAVFVGPTWQQALDRALASSDIAILDGRLQISPRRAALSLLALDARRPWGAGACPPCGDLRAQREALLGACDRAVAIGDAGGDITADHVPTHRARVVSRGVWAEDGLVPWSDLRGARVGLWTAVARPDRVLDHVRRCGVEPLVSVISPDHAPPRREALGAATLQGRRAGVELWLTTAKCAAHAPRFGGVPVATIDHQIELGPELADAILQAATPPRVRGSRTP
jgi:tetraacyldisaccharide 4'-kinase